jgi:biotin carboxyl carrier protein
MASRTLSLVNLQDDREHELELLDDSTARVNGRTYRVHRDGSGILRISGPDDRASIAWTAVSGGVRWVCVDGRVYQLAAERPETKTRARRHAGGHSSLSAPMPATVRRVLVGIGQAVKAGDTLIILEAMKMELPVRAATPGTVRVLSCREGELVQPGATLVEIDES